MSYTELTVFDGTDTLNEPVIALSVFGKLSFRQIGIIMGLVILLPLGIYSAGSSYILLQFPDPVLQFDAVNSTIHITWDIILAVFPIPIGLILGVPRPKLLPMDQFIMAILYFIIHHTSIKQKKPQRRSTKPSVFAGFAHKDKPQMIRQKNIYTLSVTEFGIPKNITITLYDLQGKPMKNKFAQSYIDGVLYGSITTDSDGQMGITYTPYTEGIKHLEIFTDGIKQPIVDAQLHIQKI